MAQYRVAVVHTDSVLVEANSHEEAARLAVGGKQHVLPVWTEPTEKGDQERRWIRGTCFICKDPTFGEEVDKGFWASGYVAHAGCAERWRKKKTEEATTWTCPKCGQENPLPMGNECQFCHA